MLASSLVSAQAQSVPLGNPSPTATALKNLFTGSRWHWFDSPDLKGKAYWVEFYRDGKMYSSWGEPFSWEIIEPSTIHMKNLKNQSESFMVVDLKKKQARPDSSLPKLSKNSMEYDKRVSSSPPKDVRF